MAFRRGYALFAMMASVAALLLNSYYHDASFGSKPVTLNIKDSKLVFSRDAANGYTPHLVSHSNKPEIDFARGLGFVHTLDRYTQMLMQKLSGQARLSEAFGTEQLREIDEFLHGVDFTNSLDESIANLSDEVKQYLEAYADGVNYAREQKRKLVPDVEGLGKFELLRKLIRSFAPKSLHEPIGDFLGKNWEFFLADYDDTEPWTIRDSLVIYKLLGYVGLADTQIYTEKIVYRAIHDGVPVEKLKIIFPKLSGITDEIVELIKKMDVSNLDSFGMPPLEFVPHFAASNNWVVHGSKTISGKPFQCNDPHLLINRLPSVWHEVVLETDNNYWMGIMLPGLPALIMGRTKDLSFGLTYGFLDQIDVWMEEIKDGQYRQRDGTFAPLKERSVVVKHKDSPTPTKLVFYSTANGQILRKSHKLGAGVPKDGIYMSEKWVVDKISDQSIRAFFPLPSPKSVSEYKKLLKHGAISANLLLSDRAGNIGYQQVGIFPVRPKHWNGFYAGIGWKEEFQWESISEPEFLLSYDNPPEGYISTANNYIESPGHPDSINLHMGFARRNRANSILASISETRKLTKDDMKRMQADVYSTEAENFLSRLAEFVPKHEVLASSKTIERLLKWDRIYTVGSKEATLFDTIVQELLIRTFGEVFGQVSWKNLRYKTGLLDFFHPYLDNVLLNDESLHAFSPKYQNLEDLMVQVLTDIAVGKDLDKDVKEWGKVHDLTLKNVFFAGKLPKFFAADAGPFPFPGTRDTLNQAARSPKTYDENERDDMFGPSWRYVTDMSQNEAETCLPGGINGNLFSSLYDNHLADFFAYKYHKIRPNF